MTFAQRVIVCCVSYHYHAQIPNVDPLSVAMQPRVNVLASSGMALHQHHLFHLVRLPNHVRVWNATAYRLLAGHKSELAAADDYNLLLRSLFAGKWVEIACVLYVQWRNPAADNFTFKRNALIQFAVHEQWSRWSQRVFEFFDQLAPGEFTPVELVKQVRRGCSATGAQTHSLCAVSWLASKAVAAGAEPAAVDGRALVDAHRDLRRSGGQLGLRHRVARATLRRRRRRGRVAESDAGQRSIARAVEWLSHRVFFLSIDHC